jgi:hypothetical protein
LVAADSADHAEDFFARFEGSDVSTDGDYGACHVEAEDCGEWLRGVASLCSADFGVEWIDASGVDLHEHLAGCG